MLAQKIKYLLSLGLWLAMVCSVAGQITTFEHKGFVSRGKS